MSKAAGLTMGYPMQGMEPRSTSRMPEKYKYNANWPIYAMGWSSAWSEHDGSRLALGSFIEDFKSSKNKLQIVTLNGVDGHRKPRPGFMTLAEVDQEYPITKVLWEPHKMRENSDLLVTSSDILRLWKLSDNGALKCKAELSNSRNSGFWGPIPSFDWVGHQLVACSIDTTCTVWDLETGQPKSQLIAHDRDVYDVAFDPQDPNIFASVGADGSVRLFDQRELERSTILYEAPSPRSNSFEAAISDTSQPLLRLQFSPHGDGLLATHYMESNSVQILDIRFPSKPVTALDHKNGHQSNVNCFQWSPQTRGQICTGGDDSRVLVWDIHGYNPQPILSAQPDAEIDPWNKAASHNNEIMSLSWSKSVARNPLGYNSWISIGYGRSVEVLSMDVS